MDNSGKFLLPSPNFGQQPNGACTPMSKPHYLTPCGMTLLPREKQPPPMYGMRGATVPAKFLPNQKQKPHQQNRHYQPSNKATDEGGPHTALYFCEACDVACTTEDHLRHHRAQHEGCPVDGCTYSGHPTVMDKHVMALHSSGLFDKFKKISTPEEIAAWREERRKKYPTVANVEMRQLAKEQRQKRGERLEEKRSRFGKPEDRRGMGTQRADRAEGQRSARERKNQRNKKKRSNRRSMNVQNRPQGIQRESGDRQASQENEITHCCNIKMFRGTSKMKDYKHLKKKQTKESNALSSLLGMYGSESESNDSNTDDDEKDCDTIMNGKITAAQDYVSKKANLQMVNAPVETKTVEVQVSNQISNTRDEHSMLSTEIVGCQDPKEIALQSGSSKSVCSNRISSSRSSDEAPDETPIERISNLPAVPAKKTVAAASIPGAPPAKRTKTEPTKFERNVRKSGLNYRQTNLRKQNTLLEKLLESDIRHERNVLLQCVRFVCTNDFFGKAGSHKS